MKSWLCGNWKMHFSLEDVQAYFDQFHSEVKDLGSGLNVQFSGPSVYLQAACSLAQPYQIGSQNIHALEKGAFTGEVSAPMVRSVGGSFTLIGHSERRQYFGETDQEVADKVAIAKKHKLTPMICVGETQEQREKGETSDVISRQLAAVLPQIDEQDHIFLAYEPVWAIGTGLSATPQMAEEVHQMIRNSMNQALGRDFGARTPILYGGSVNTSNLKDLLKMENIDGGLVGGASLKPQTFAQLVEIAAKV